MPDLREGAALLVVEPLVEPVDRVGRSDLTWDTPSLLTKLLEVAGLVELTAALMADDSVLTIASRKIQHFQ